MDQSFTDLLSQGVARGTWAELEDLTPIYGEQVPLAVTPNVDIPYGPRRSKNFSSDEDKALTLAWLNVSLDASVGINQSRGTYWGRIAEEFRSIVGGNTDRTKNSLSHRWTAIQESVTKFVLAHDSILRKNASGTTDNDKMGAAMDLYNGTEGKPFGLVNCWLILRNQPKWNATLMAKRDKNGPSNSPASNQNPGLTSSSAGTPQQDGSKERPEGMKAAKARKHRASQDESSSVAMAAVKSFDAMAQKLDSKKDERLAMLLTIEREKVEIMKRKQATAEMHEAADRERMDMQVMSIDLSTLHGPKLEYYADLQNEIMERRRQKKAWMQSSVSPGTEG